MPAAIIELNQMSLELINIIKENFITEKHKEHKTTVTQVFSVLRSLDSLAGVCSVMAWNWSHYTVSPR